MSLQNLRVIGRLQAYEPDRERHPLLAIGR